MPMIAICDEDDFFTLFGLEFEWATQTLVRLDAMQAPTLFADLDDQILFALSNSALPA